MAAPKGLALLLEPKGKGPMEDDEEAPPSSRRMGEMDTEKAYTPAVQAACKAAFEAVKADDEEGFCRAIFDAHMAIDKAVEDEEGE